MIKDLIVDTAPPVLIALAFILCITKLSMISASINKNLFSLFINSFGFYNRVTIRNTFHEKLKDFYRRSNKVNTFFYTIIAGILAIYLLMKSI